MPDFFAKPPIVIIQSGKAKSEMIAHALIAHHGGKIAVEPTELPKGYSPVVVGAWRTTAHWLRQFERERIPYLYVDNGYFRPYKDGGHFRVTANALQYAVTTGGPLSPQDQARWQALAVETQPYRMERGPKAPILLVLQTPQWFSMMGLSREEWVRQVLCKIESVTDRPIRVREKPLKGSGPSSTITEDMDGCWAVVGLSSNCLIQAHAMGIPTFALGPCAATPLSLSNLAMIEEPLLPVGWRESVFAALAANQWTLREIESGLMWRELAARPQAPFLSLA